MADIFNIKNESLNVSEDTEHVLDSAPSNTEEDSNTAQVGEAVSYFTGVGFTDTVVYLTEIYDITLNTGDVLRFTSFDIDLSWEGNTYQAIPIERGTITQHSDLEIDKLDVTLGLIGIYIGDAQYTVQKAVEKGFFRNSEVKVRVIDYTNQDNTHQRTIFAGFVTGGTSYDLGSITLKCGSALAKINEFFPKFIYSEFCPHVLFDGRCGLDSAGWTFSASVTSTSSSTDVASTEFEFATHEEGYWVGGTITFDTGNNSQESRTIISHNDGYVTLLTPFHENILVGDDFTAIAGCDKTGTTCYVKFENYDNFLGFEYIPNAQDLYNAQ